MAEKILNSYETIFIIDATLDEETVTALKDKFTTLIEQNGELKLRQSKCQCGNGVSVQQCNEKYRFAYG